MNRRSFIGSVIGTLATGKTFSAMTPEKVLPLTDRQRCRLFAAIPDMTDAELLKFKMYVYVELPESNERVKFMAPRLTKIVRKDTPHELNTSLVSEGVSLKVTCTALGVGVLTPQNQLLVARSYHSRVHYMPGDTLNNTYTVIIPILEADNLPKEQ